MWLGFVGDLWCGMVWLVVEIWGDGTRKSYLTNGWNGS